MSIFLHRWVSIYNLTKSLPSCIKNAPKPKALKTCLTSLNIEGIFIVSTGFWQNMGDHSIYGSRKFGKVWDVVGLNESLWYECPKVLVEL